MANKKNTGIKIDYLSMIFDTATIDEEEYKTEKKERKVIYSDSSFVIVIMRNVILANTI